MNKFYEIKESSIRGDLNFIKKLDYGVKKENENSRTKVCTHPKPRHQHIGDNDTRFSSHPKRIFSDTDASVFDSSPRRVNLSSSESNINLGNNEGLFYQFYEEKVEFKNIRKKLHKKLTQTKEDSSFHIEMCIGDSSSVSPRSARGKRSVIFEDECLQSHIEPPKEVKGKPKHRSVTTIPSKRVVPSNSAPVNNAYNKSVISDSVFEKKFKMFVEKSLHTITDIRSMLETGITPPDGDEDITRRTVRVREFSNRFSRNYLYPLSRQLEDLNKMAADDLNANHKFLTAYQIVLNGLQTYLNHLPSSIGSCSSDKLKLLLKHLLEICCMHNKTIKQPDENGLTDFIDTFKLNAELTLQKVEDHFSAVTTDTDSILKSTVTKVSLQRGASKATLKSAPKKKKIEKRLSMYSVPASFRKDANWKKAVEGLAKKKLNVKSRYKTAAFVHRPPREKETPQVMPFPSHCKLFCKKSSSMLKNSPTITSVDEDAIMTMVQMEDKKERGGDSCDEPPNEGEPKGQLNHEEIVVKLLQLVLDNNQKKVNDENTGNAAGPTEADRHIADILEKLRNESNVDTLQKILDGLKKDSAEGEKQELQIITSQCNLGERKAKNWKEPKVTVTGEKNAKLICIKDENSIIEAKPDAEHQTKAEPTKTVHKTKEKSTKKSKTSTMKLTRRPKSSKVLQMLPKNYAVNVIQYKLDFHKFCKSDPMYRKTSTVEPWLLMGKVSDQILDHILLGIAREIELNDVIQEMYDSELAL